MGIGADGFAEGNRNSFGGENSRVARNTMHFKKRMNNLNNLMSPSGADLGGDGVAEQSTGGFNEHATLMMTDIDIFGNELVQFTATLKKSLMERRVEQNRMRDDPQEELEEVMADVTAMEEEFRKALGISNLLLGHSRKLINDNQEL